MKWLLALLLSVTSGAALAETTGAVNPGSVPAQPSVNEDVPPGGCMPIGMTSAGEIVFPIQCKEFIERHRGAAVEQKPSVEQKPAAVQAKPDAVRETHYCGGKARRCRGKARRCRGEARRRGAEARGCRGEVCRKTIGKRGAGGPQTGQ